MVAGASARCQLQTDSSDVALASTPPSQEKSYSSSFPFDGNCGNVQPYPFMPAVSFHANAPTAETITEPESSPATLLGAKTANPFSSI